MVFGRGSLPICWFFVPGDDCGSKVTINFGKKHLVNFPENVSRN